MPIVNPSLLLNGIKMPVTTTNTTTFNGGPVTRLQRNWNVLFNPITFTKSGSNISISASNIGIELTVSNTTTYRLTGLTVYRSDNSTVLANAYQSNSSLTNPLYEISATNIDSTSISAGYIYITATARTIVNGEETDREIYNFMVYFNSNDTLSTLFIREVEYNNTLDFSIFTKTSSAAGFGKEIKSYRTNITPTIGVSNFTSGATIAARTVTSSLSDLQTIILKNINQTGTDETISFNIEGISTDAGTYVTQNNLVETVNYNVKFLSDAVLSISSITPESLVYDEITDLFVLLDGTYSNVDKFSITSTDSKIIGSNITFGSKYTFSNYIYIRDTGPTLYFKCKQTAKENGTGNLKITLYDSSNLVLQELTFGMTLTYVPKNVLTSIKTDLFKRVPNLKKTIKENISSIINSSFGFDSVVSMAGTTGGGNYYGDYEYPCSYDGDNETYEILYHDDGQGHDTTQIFRYETEPCTVHTNKIRIYFHAIAEDINEQPIPKITIYYGQGNNYIEYTSFEINANQADGETPELYEYIIDNIDFYNKNVRIDLEVSYYGGAICGCTVDYISNTSTITSKRPNALMVYINPNSIGDGNPCGLQKTQVWPPIYDVTLGELSTNIPSAGATNNIYTTSYTYTSNISNGTLPYLSAPISYSADSPNTSISANIYATSGNTGTVFYRTANLSSLNSTYLGTYISCYVNAKSESTTQDSTHFCRIKFYSWADDDQIGSTSYIANTSFSKYTIANRVWITRDNWNNYYKMQNGGVYVELGVANYGGLIRGITIKLEYVKYINKIAFPVEVNRYGGPIIEEVNTTGYTYLRSGAIKMIYSPSAFQNSNLATSNTYFNTSSYSIKNNTKDNANTLSYTNDSYTLFLKTSNYYSSEFKIPDNRYIYNAYSATLGPSTFGYYFCGYFTLPNTSIWESGSGSTRQINYTGTNILDWNSSSYISRYRLTGFSGFKGWTTKRTPIEWTASWNSSSLVYTQSVTVTFNSNSWAGSNYSPKYLYLTNKGSINYLWSKDYSGSGALSNDWTEMHGQYGLGGNVTMSNDGSPGTYGIESLSCVNITSTSNGITVTVNLNTNTTNNVLQRIVTNTSGSTLQIQTRVANSGNTNTHYLNNKTYYDSSLSRIRNSSHTSISIYLIYTGNYGLQNWASVPMGHEYLGTIYWVPTKWKYEVVYTS